MSRNRTICILMTAVATCSAVRPVGAAPCTVPSTPHTTIQAAIDDHNCTEIMVAAGVFAEAPVISRDLLLQGAGSDQTFIEGQVDVASGVVHLTGLHVAAAGQALSAHSGAQVAGLDLVAESGPGASLIFADGFESGAASAWSSSTP